MLQFFVGLVQDLNCRADSLLLMKRARELRVELLQSGVAAYKLPKLIGNAGAAWFKQWRYENEITKQITGM